MFGSICLSVRPFVCLCSPAYCCQSVIYCCFDRLHHAFNFTYDDAIHIKQHILTKNAQTLQPNEHVYTCL